MLFKLTKYHKIIDSSPDDNNSYKDIIMISLRSGKSIKLKLGLYELLINEEFHDIPDELMLKLIHKEFLCPEVENERYILDKRLSLHDSLAIVYDTNYDLSTLEIIKNVIKKYNFNRIELIYINNSKVSKDFYKSLKKVTGLDCTESIYWSNVDNHNIDINDGFNHYLVTNNKDEAFKYNSLKNTDVLYIYKDSNTIDIELIRKKISVFIDNSKKIENLGLIFNSFDISGYNHSYVYSDLKYLKQFKGNKFYIDLSKIASQIKLHNKCDDCYLLYICGGYNQLTKKPLCPVFKDNINNYYLSMLNEKVN